MTLGPMVPESRGRSTVLPVVLSVRVTVSCDAAALLVGEALFINIPLFRARADRRHAGDASHGRPAALDGRYVALQIYQVQPVESRYFVTESSRFRVSSRPRISST